MARKATSTIMQEELYPSASTPARVELDDSRLVDLDVDEESPFLRAQKRIPARRSSLPRKTASRLMWATAAVIFLCIAGVAAAGVYRYGERSWRFRLESSDDIEITGTQNVTKAQIIEALGADIGRNIFFIPLAQQKAQLEQIPWVESASVMRFVPNRLKVEIHERTPVAFARIGPKITLIDAHGTLMELPPKHKYSFPVVLGMNPGEPLSTRAPRMKAYEELIRELDSGGAHYSQDLSEVDLSDLEDMKVRVNDPAGDVLVHLGSSNYLARFKVYVGHVQEWRQQFQKLESVDLRYDSQIIVNPDMQGMGKQAALSPSAAKAARAAGVKPAALTTKIGPHGRPIPKPVFELSPEKLNPKAAASSPLKPASRWKPKKGVTRGKRGGSRKKHAAEVTPANSAARDAGAVASHNGGSSQKAAAGKISQSGAHTAGASVSRSKPSPAIAKPQEKENQSSN
jgi:cell division protein FtsQ